jgi:putative N6-adenine-specific DNA methylase
MVVAPRKPTVWQRRDWRVGLVTSDTSLSRLSGLPFATTAAPVLHGGLRVTLFLTDPLK